MAEMQRRRVAQNRAPAIAEGTDNGPPGAVGARVEPRMQLLIGNKNYSSWSLRPWVLLRHFGIPFEEVMVRFDSLDPRAAGLGWRGYPGAAPAGAAWRGCRRRPRRRRAAGPGEGRG